MAAKRAAKAELRSHAGDEDIAVEKLTDLATGLAWDALAVHLSVKTAQAHVVRGMRKLAAAAVGKGEVTQVGMILVFGHRNLQRRI
ncbi:MAG TPA: hypothetical protein VGF61_22570 [Candidatus Acidoferrum sp.]